MSDTGPFLQFFSERFRLRLGAGRVFVCAALAAVVPLAAVGQAPEASAAVPDTPAPAPILAGDVLHLKSGMVLSGVQILRSTPLFFEVELVEGIEPMRIPRNQVERVEKDDIEPLRDRRNETLFLEPETVSLASGEPVSPKLMDKLSAPLSDEPLSYKKKDFAEILRQIAGDRGVKLRIHPSVRNLDAAKRQWTFETKPDATLLSLLRHDLVTQFNYIEVVFELDSVVVLTKKAAVALKAKKKQEQE